jgi:hypothetical protein
MSEASRVRLRSAIERIRPARSVASQRSGLPKEVNEPRDMAPGASGPAVRGARCVRESAGPSACSPGVEVSGEFC